MSKIALPFIDDQSPFPALHLALENPDGLLCFGANLSVARLLNAYRNGIFPWYSDGEPILWWSPSTRCIINPKHFHCSQSLRKHIRKTQPTVSINTAFEQVITACAHIPRFDSDHIQNGTWITHEMQQAYCELHQAGFAHSIEIWQEEQLIGGLYGVLTDRVFCGESMFHLQTNASKVAMFALASLLKSFSSAFIDCQLPTPHLHSLGAKDVSRKQFIRMLKAANQSTIPSAVFAQRSFTLEI